MATASKKSLLTLLEFEPDEIIHMLSRAAQLKRTRLVDDPPVFKGKTGVLIFEKPSLRTRITFEVAIHELGGHTVNLASESVQIGRRESVEDVARNLERWVHLIVARTFSHTTIEQLANSCSVPVINALTDAFHPCQALAFALTLREHRPDMRSTHVVFVGDGNNVCSSIMVLCAKLGYHFTLVCPTGYESPDDVLSACRAIASKTGSRIEISTDVHAALATATAVYTDVWTSMGQERESEQRKRSFRPLQLNRELLAHAPADALISHCLPAHRGEEITSDVLDGPNSVALDEAENRLHVQKAVIAHLCA
jgi:ornithine carbamoyltransferase